jgi:hypothetical protein
MMRPDPRNTRDPRDPHDPTERLLHQYFAERVEEEPAAAVPDQMGADRSGGDGGAQAGRGRFRVVVAKAAIAAVIALTIWLPFTEAGRETPSARGFASIHEELDTGRVISEGLRLANVFLTTHLSGDESHD